jgi:flagellar M-ring protein FliF
MKSEIEEYVTHKVAKLLDSAYGPGQAIVSADVALNFDEIKHTIQNLQPGTIRHKHQVTTGAEDPDTTPALDVADKVPPAHTGNTTTDVDYEYGRSIEQVIAAPGGITRLSIGVIVPGELSEEKQRRITDLVRMAAGINEGRGDAVVVQPLDQLGIKAAPSVPAIATEAAQPIPDRPTLPVAAFSTRQVVLGALLLIVLTAALAWTLLARRNRPAVPLIGKNPPSPLSTQERQQLLLEIQRALGAKP